MDTIAAISDKIAAALQIPALTRDELEAEAAERVPFLTYLNAATPDVCEALRFPTPDYGCPINPEGDLFEVILAVSLYLKSSSRDPQWYAGRVERGEAETVLDAALEQEDDDLSRIPVAYLPADWDGIERTAERRENALTALEVLFDEGDPDEGPVLRPIREQFNDKIAARFLPADFTPAGTGEAAKAEMRLAAWAAMREQRDQIVREALAAGVTKSRVHEITGISRSTIDRIPGV